MRREFHKQPFIGVLGKKVALEFLHAVRIFKKPRKNPLKIPVKKFIFNEIVVSYPATLPKNELCNGNF